MGCSLLATPSTAQAQDTQTIEATVLLRALSYDRNLKERAGSSVVAAVVFRPTGSRDKSNAVVDAFSKLEKVKVQSLPFRVLAVPYQDPATLRATLVKEGVDLVYVSPGLTAEIPAISTLTRDLDVLTAGSQRGDIVEGLALGVFERSNKRVILVNLAASKAEGASFSAQFLRLAEVIR
jgi:hypothetical protein